MKFTLTIEGSVTDLAGLCAHMASYAQPDAEVTTDFEPASTPAYTPPPAAPASNGKPKAKAAAPKATPAPQPVIESTGAFDDLPEETVTLDMIRLASKSKLSKQPKIIEILSSYGATNMSTLEAEHYSEVYAKINAL